MNRTALPLALFWSACALAGAWAGFDPAASRGEEDPPARCPEPVVAPMPSPARGLAAGGDGAAAREGAGSERLLTPHACALRLQEDRLRSLEPMFAAGHEVEPLPWPEGVDVEAERAAFEAALDEGHTACGTAAEVVDVDCSEPPCVALVEGAYDVQGCGEAVFGDAPWQAGQELLCPDGSRQRLSLVAPGAGPDPQVDPAAALDHARRLLARYATLRDTVRCVEW